MRTPPAPAIDPWHDRHDPLARRLQALSGRIDGLSMALGVDLDDEQQLKSLLRCGAAEPVPAQRLPAADRRLAHKRMELCGLVVMRYVLIPHTIAVLGRH